MESPKAHCGPISLESERRKAMGIVFAIEKQSDNFREKWLMDASDENNETWLHFIAYLRSKAGMKKCKTYKEFGENLEPLKSQTNVAHHGKKIIPQLEEIIERARRFDELVKFAKKKLKKALDDHLSKYCLSFYDKLRGHEVECVTDYENQIGQWESELRVLLKELREKYHEFKENEGHSFESYVHNYDKLLRLMEEIIDMLPNICDILKSWVIADEAYPRKLLDEINRQQARKEEINDTFRQFHKRSEESASKIRKTDYSSKKVNDKLQAALKERRLCRKMEMTLQDNINIIEEEIAEKQKEIEETFQKMNSKQNLSTSAYKALLEKAQKLQGQIPKLEKKAKAMVENMSKLKKQRYRVQKEVHRFQVVHENSVKATRKVRMMAQKDEKDAKNLMEEQKTIVMQLQALKRVREIKCHPLTVKKIYAGENHQGHDLDVSGFSHKVVQGYTNPLTDAIKLTAKEVGKDWPELYQKLPFNPPRDSKSKNKDIEIIDVGSGQLDKGYDELALRGLRKWRRLSVDASTKALARTLKSLKKQEIAEKLVRQVVIVT